MARSQEQTVDQLVDINAELTDRERQGAAGQTFFEELLDPRFRFRRGDGSTVTRAAFIKSLADPGNVNEILETEIRQIQVLGDQAFVEALVQLKGRRRGKEVDGTFRNLRLSSGGTACGDSSCGSTRRLRSGSASSPRLAQGRRVEAVRLCICPD